MKKFALLAAIAVTLSTPVAAKETAKKNAPATTKETTPSVGESGWGGAHWGMNVAEVLAAAGSEADTVDLKDKGKWVWEQPQGVQATTQFLGYSYQVEYHFTPKGDKLSIIGITSEDEAACDALEDHFKTHLGEGKEERERFEVAPKRFMIIGGRDWSDIKNDNRFSFTNITTDPNVLTFCKMLLQDPSMKFVKK